MVKPSNYLANISINLNKNSNLDLSMISVG